MASHCHLGGLCWSNQPFSKLCPSASIALTLASARAGASRVQNHRLRGELDRASAKIALLKEELDINFAANEKWPTCAHEKWTTL
jgi:hypothetical protein